MLSSSTQSCGSRSASPSCPSWQRRAVTDPSHKRRRAGTARSATTTKDARTGGGPAVAKGKSIESSGEDEGDCLNPALQCSEDDSEQYYTFSASIIDKLQGRGVGNMPIPEISEEGAAI